MKPTDIILPVLALFVGLLIGVYLIAPLLSAIIVTQPSPFLFALLYYLGPPILTAAGAGFGFIWFRGRIREDKHRQEILRILKMPVASKGEVEYLPNLSGEMTIERPLSWIDSEPLYPYCIAHLQNYKEMLSLLEEARAYSDNRRAIIISRLRSFEQTVDERLRSFKTLPALDRPSSETKPYFLKKMLRYVVLKDVENLLEEQGMPAELSQAKLKSGRRRLYELRSGSEVLAVGSAASLKKLTTLIRTMESDRSVVKVVADVKRLQKGLEKNYPLLEFEAKRSQIAFALSAGQHRLPGHCERCP